MRCSQIFLKNLVIVTFLSCGVGQKLLANEGGGEHGGGAAPAATEATAHYSGKQSQAWSEIQTKLAALKAKVEAQEAVVKSLISSSHSASGGSGHGESPAPAAGGHGGGGAVVPSVSGSTVELLKVEHQKWQQLVEEYNQLNHEYETKFPEKGIKESRVYQRLESSDLETFEKQMTVDEKINESHRKIIKQYPRAFKDKLDQAGPAEVKKKKTNLKNKKATETETENSVTDTILLKK